LQRIAGTTYVNSTVMGIVSDAILGLLQRPCRGLDLVNGGKMDVVFEAIRDEHSALKNARW
jgi:hypothetical protein